MEKIPQIDVNDLYALNLDGLLEVNILAGEYKSKLDKLIEGSNTTEQCINSVMDILPLETLSKIQYSTIHRLYGIGNKLEGKLKQIVCACDVYIDASPRKDVCEVQTEINGEEIIPTNISSSVAWGLKSNTDVKPFSGTYGENMTTSFKEIIALSDVFSDEVIEKIIDGIYETVNMYNSEMKQFVGPLYGVVDIVSKQPLLEQRVNIINACLNEVSSKPFSEKTDYIVGVLKENIDALNNYTKISDSVEDNAKLFAKEIKDQAERYIRDNFFR